MIAKPTSNLPAEGASRARFCRAATALLCGAILGVFTSAAINIGRAAAVEVKELPCVELGCPESCTGTLLSSVQATPLNQPVCGLARLPLGSGCNRGFMVNCAQIFTYLGPACASPGPAPGPFISAPHAGFGSTPC